MFCMQCGTQVPEGTNFCPKCGFAFCGVQSQISYEEEPATRQLKLIRKKTMFNGANLNMEVDLMNDYGDCVEANSLYNGSSCFMTCRCDSKYHIRANMVGGLGWSPSEATIEPGEKNLTVEIASTGTGKLKISHNNSVF